MGPPCKGTLLILSRRAATGMHLEELNRALRSLWVESKAWCKVRRLSTTVPVFSLKIISFESNTDYPTLAKRIKGAASRLILKWLAVKVHHAAYSRAMLLSGLRNV